MNKLTVRLALAVVLAAAALIPARADELVASAGNIHACFIDLQEVLENYTDYVKAKTDLEEWAKPKKQLIENQKGEIEKLDKALKKNLLLSEDAKKEKESEFKEKLGNYQEMVGQIQTDLSSKEEELLAPIKESLSKTIEEISKARGFNVVFDASAPGGRPILYIDDSLDITKLVVDKVKANSSADKSDKPDKKDKPAAPEKK